MATIEDKVNSLGNIEEKAEYYFEHQDWPHAIKQYHKLLKLADGWLAPKDPNVLYMKAHLSEALMKSGKDEDASGIQRELLNAVGPPESDEEKRILKQVLHLRIDLAQTLFGRRRDQEALDILLDALEYSLEGLGRKNKITESLRESRDVVNKEKLRKEQAKIRKKLDRVAKRKDEGYGEPSTEAATTNVLVPASPSVRRGRGESSVPASPEIRLISPVHDGDGEDARTDSKNVLDRRGTLTSRPRLSSMPNQLPSQDLHPRKSRTKVSESTNNEAEVTPYQRNLEAGHSSSGGLGLAIHGFQPPEFKSEDVSESDAPQAPLLIRRGTERSKSVDHSVRGLQSTISDHSAERTVRPDFSDADLLDGSEKDYAETDEWFSVYLRETHKLLKLGSNLKPDLRPRIAILDTGLNTDHAEVKKILNPEAREDRRIRGFWAPPSTKWSAKEDLDGHGTHCAMVAHKVAPNAHIYIARVFRDRQYVDGKHIVEAIEHAVKVWDVDIISMSFAIATDDRETKTAMTDLIRTIKNKVLLFAAASNSGLSRDRAYPAKLHEEVFGIHAARGLGGKYDRNPAPHWKDPNFTTLGLYVKAPYTGQESKRCSGTSMASPVAAGIAALVLEFCRQSPLNDGDAIEKPQRLKMKLGMERVFLQMLNPYERTELDTEGRYFWLRPWDLLSLSRGGGDHKKARKDIAVTINGALRSIDDYVGKE